MTRLQLTDAEWEFMGPCLPIGKYGPYPERLRQQFEGVIWRFRTGGQRREMPQKFGAWSTVHNRFRQWREAAFLGRSLGGQASKVHLAADRRCRPLAFVLTAGQAADSPQVIPVRVRGPVGPPRTFLDEWAYQRPYRSNDERTAALTDFLHTCNHHRSHTALNGKPPISRINNAAGQYT